MLVYLLQLQMKLFTSNSEPMVVRKVIPTAERIASFRPKKPFEAIKKINFFDLVRSFDLVRIFDLVQSFDLLVHASVAQGADGLGLMNNEDHQVLRNEQKLEEDAFDCTRVDDDGVEFSPEDGNYFPTMGDETKKDKFSIFLLLLIICIVLMLMDGASYGAGLDEVKHDLSTKESVAQKCKDVIVKNKREIIRANIEPNKAGLEKVVDLDPDQLPTLAFVVFVSSIIPISNLSHKNFAQMMGMMTLDLVCHLTYQLLRSSFGDFGPDMSFDMPASSEHLSGSACVGDHTLPHAYQYVRAELVYSDLRNYKEFYKFSSMPMHGLVICIGIMYRSSILILHYHIGTPGPMDGANFKSYLCGPLRLGKRASNVRIVWFSFGSFGGGSFESVSFSSPAESKNVVQLSLLWSADATDSGPKPSFDRPAISGVPFWHQVPISQVSSKEGLLRISASSWHGLLGLSLGLKVVDCHYLLLLSRRRYVATILQSFSASLHISNIYYMYIKSHGFRLFSSLPGVLTPVRAINGFDMPLPVAVCSRLVNPLAP
ncbi:hypothetical protein Tco_0777396, partial [Tanacetum coccineum]